jgi:hypothetical protein
MRFFTSWARSVGAPFALALALAGASASVAVAQDPAAPPADAAAPADGAAPTDAAPADGTAPTEAAAEGEAAADTGAAAEAPAEAAPEEAAGPEAPEPEPESPFTAGLVISLIALGLGGLSAVLGIWVDRDKTRPAIFAGAMSVLIIAAVSVGMIQGYMDSEGAIQQRADLKRMMDMVTEIAVASGDPELIALVAEEGGEVPAVEAAPAAAADGAAPPADGAAPPADGTAAPADGAAPAADGAAPAADGTAAPADGAPAPGAPAPSNP